MIQFSVRDLVMPFFRFFFWNVSILESIVPLLVQIFKSFQTLGSQLQTLGAQIQILGALQTMGAL